MDETSPWLDVSGAAARLGVTEHWVRRHTHLMPHGRVGAKFLRFHRDELDAWVQAGGLSAAEAPGASSPVRHRVCAPHGPAAAATVTADTTADADGAAAAAAKFRHLDTIKRKRVSWLWKPYLPFGKVTTWDGDPGEGKSTLVIDIFACITTGRPLPDGTPTTEGVVLFVSAEDGAADTIRPRVEAAGGDPSKVYVLNPESPELLTLPDDTASLERFVTTHHVVAMVLDPISAFLGEGVDGHKDQHVRRVLAPLAGMAERTRVAVIVIRHLTKGQAKAIYRGQGSIAFIGAARSGLLVVTDPDDGDRHFLAHAKCNIAKKGATWVYALTTNAHYDVATVRWIETTDQTAEQLLDRADDTDGPDRTERDDAATWLIDVLADGGLPARDVFARARIEGHSDRTVKRAKKELGIRSVKQGLEGGWVWVLPSAEEGHGDPKRVEQGHRSESGPLRSSSGNGGPLRGTTTTPNGHGHDHQQLHLVSDERTAPPPARRRR